MTRDELLDHVKNGDLWKLTGPSFPAYCTRFLDAPSTCRCGLGGFAVRAERRWRDSSANNWKAVGSSLTDATLCY